MAIATAFVTPPLTMPPTVYGKLRYTTNLGQLEIPDGVFVTNNMAVVIITAMALGEYAHTLIAYITDHVP